MVEGRDLREIVERVVKGEVKLHELDKLLGNSNLAALVRRLALEKITGVSLSSIGSTILDFEELVGRNIENPIGAVQVPVGIVGPLRVQGEYARGDFYVPLATTEGALVASVNRGAKAVTLAGGAKTRILRDGMTRAPVIWTPSVEEAVKLVKWVEENIDVLKKAAESTTRHGKLKGLTWWITGNLVWLRFEFETGDAMGMNMVTIAVDKALQELLNNYDGDIRVVALSGNMCVDKKPSILNMLLGRGKTVVAEAIIPRDVVREVLKTTPEAIHEVNVAKNLMGSARAGSLSYNAHYANIIAAIFIATGQDVAQVVESSMGYTWTEVRNGDLYISVTLPSLEVGTVGGGTRLPTQREALALMGVGGSGNPPGTNAKKFAEIVAATVLAGELSLLAALAAGHLAKAHIKLGRGELNRSDSNIGSKVNP
ncbi:3-hydroxy-3-methylglutaryl Coenzyme A reductase [Pyrolobus fumarii 1A]|uniref:3-hydroxy-3-methylglutaryl coenzyme A reductase n=1 Tax=Pyrolobus fumarii (strain DSM 11204 / 1A) TaxID=694429 RepID=G0EC68_PYRF1|nr:hydroxymethylglutaryl-CoA reductase (NADPH) [Pyrolobus fumarii]AEM39438.1 3-hydroxy-3-methylglutaryl Coenzyme A reductase [Pyrolobus fumarii 1A]